MHAGKRLLFAVEGSWRGTATLRDTGTRSLWLQLTGTCVDGPLKGARLQQLPTGRHTPWALWVRDHPDTQVMARDARNLRGIDEYLTKPIQANKVLAMASSLLKID